MFTRQFSRVLTPCLSSRFFTGISRRRYVAYVYNGEIVSLIGNQRVGIFPPKSEILFVLSLALIWCQNFQDGSILVGGDTWPSCTSERRIIIRIRIKKYHVQGYVLPVKYLRNGKRYSSSVFSKNQGQESCYQTVQTSSLLLLSFQRYWSRYNHEFRMLTYSTEQNQKAVER